MGWPLSLLAWRWHWPCRSWQPGSLGGGVGLAVVAAVAVVDPEVTPPGTQPPPRPEPVLREGAPPPASAGDRDGDGVLDPVDRCPDKAEDPDHFEDQHGCPDEDNDKDGISDARDICPDAAEVVNGIND